MSRQTNVRRLGIILGDQLDRASILFESLDLEQDCLWMAEVSGESTHVWSHKARTALFLSAMRHFRDELIASKWPIEYRSLNDPKNTHSLATELQATLDKFHPTEVYVVEPGDHRVKQMLLAVCPNLRILTDQHFLSSAEEFATHAKGRKQLRLEYFYRELRRRHNILMDGELPVGGAWNFDADNRSAFPASGPPPQITPKCFPPDAITREIIDEVETTFSTHPGNLAHFDWPVTPHHAQLALDDFIAHRLPFFGQFQDAMWTDETYLFHSRISAALNLKLLHPSKVIAAAEQAYRQGAAPLASVEGFIRQILGWREYVRGIYWRFMPDYAEGNALAAHQPLPDFYWTAATPMNCLQQTIRQTLDYGYAHHIQRLMVTGLYALLLGVDPKQVHQWYLAVYVDAVEWVELPNVIGMSQFADGGIMASKPYAATGKYIQRMSNYCKGCKFNPAEAVGDSACPFTTLYWDFLIRNEQKLKKIPRMELQLKNLIRLTTERRQLIEVRAQQIKENKF